MSAHGAALHKSADDDDDRAGNVAIARLPSAHRAPALDVDQLREALGAEADLMARGWQVFMPIFASKGHDVIATKQSRILTFEVRSASRNTAGTPVFAKKPDCASDVYALVITGEPVIYDPPLP